MDKQLIAVDQIAADSQDFLHELQNCFIKRKETYLISKDRRLIGWDEILEGPGIEKQNILVSLFFLWKISGY
jgi:hexosaminidase